jgi:hypothetical protein
MSQTVSVDVKLKGAVVAVVDVDVYENIEEAMAALGDAKCVDLINRQNKADIANKSRAEHRPSSQGKKKLRQLAFEMCSQDTDLQEKVESLMGDFEGLTNFLDSLADQVKASLATE